MGCYEDDANRSKIAKLLRYTTTKSEGKEISLEKYLANMVEKQDQIYYASGDDMEVLKKLPNLQIFNKKNIEVLLLTDSLDETCISRMTDYQGKKFTSIQKADCKLPEESEEEKERFTDMSEYYKPLSEWWKTKLNAHPTVKANNARLDDVVISKTLTESPCTVISCTYGWSAVQEKSMRSSLSRDNDRMSFMAGGKNLEINGDHPVIHDLLKKVKENADDETAHDIAITLFMTAMLESGFEMQDPTDLAASIFKMMSDRLGVDPEAKVEAIEVPKATKKEEKKEEGGMGGMPAGMEGMDFSKMMGGMEGMDFSKMMGGKGTEEDGEEVEVEEADAKKTAAEEEQPSCTAEGTCSAEEPSVNMDEAAKEEPEVEEKKEEEKTEECAEEKVEEEKREEL